MKKLFKPFFLFAGLFIITFFTAPFFANAFPFLDRTTYSVDDAPRGSVAGDFDEDGNIDLATASFNTLNVSLLTGNGDGTFDAMQNFRAGATSSPVGILTGDFNNDDHLDIALRNNDPAGLTILLGDGSGGFATTTMADGSGGFLVGQAVYDFDGDGNDDIAMPVSGSKVVMIYMSNGDGTFATSTTASIGGAPQQLTVGDFDGDDTVDLVVAQLDAAKSFTFLSGNGDGTFDAGVDFAISGVSGTLPVQSADVDNDGDRDLVLFSFTPRRIWVVLGDGAGSFATSSAQEYTPAANTSNLTVTDLNDDGYADIIGGADPLPVFLNDGDGTFTLWGSFDIGTTPLGVPPVADFNEDGVVDVATADFSDDTVSVLLGDEAGLSVTPTSIALEEGDAGDISIVLEASPNAQVDIALTASDADTDLSVAGVCFVVTGGGAGTGSYAPCTEWDEAQTVTITATDNTEHEGGERTRTVSLVASTTDPLYTDASAEVSVTIDDDEISSGGGSGGHPRSGDDDDDDTPKDDTIARLEALIAELKAKLAVLLGGTSALTMNPFTRDLAEGVDGTDVTALQQYLIKANKGPAAAALAAHGTTDHFGPLTKAALVEFQAAAGIIPAAGYFGPITKAYVASHAQ